MHFSRRGACALFHCFIVSLFHSFIVSKRDATVHPVGGSRRRVPSPHTDAHRPMSALRSLVDARVAPIVAPRRRATTARVRVAPVAASRVDERIDVSVAAPRLIAAALALTLATTPTPASAIPQTSECATNSCDGCVRDDASDDASKESTRNQSQRGFRD